MHVFSLIYFDILRTSFNESGNLENNLAYYVKRNNLLNKKFLR